MRAAGRQRGEKRKRAGDYKKYRGMGGSRGKTKPRICEAKAEEASTHHMARLNRRAKI